MYAPLRPISPRCRSCWHDRSIRSPGRAVLPFPWHSRFSGLVRWDQRQPRRKDPVDALKYAVEMLGKGYADVVIVDLRRLIFAISAWAKINKPRRIITKHHQAAGRCWKA